MKTAILFDLDGTLLNTLEDLTDATNAALAMFGYPPRTTEEVRRFVGNGAWHQIRMAVPETADDTAAEQVLALNPDGVMLSNGPGDPAENTEIIAEITKLMGRVPVFGICLGHQLMALSQGGQTTKLKYGHRGGNQPVKDLAEGRTYITSQNHGYAVVSDSVKNGVVRYVNANDGTCEGVDYPELRAFSVQFHPEACSGPHDTQFLFDRFLALMKGEN